MFFSGLDVQRQRLFRLNRQQKRDGRSLEGRRKKNRPHFSTQGKVVLVLITCFKNTENLQMFKINFSTFEHL